MDELTGTMLGRYHLLRLLARGGMSKVYLASREKSEQCYAIKVVQAGNEHECLRFQREVQTLMTAKHPHIIPVLEYGQQRSLSYYVMPYLEEGSLKERLATGPLTIDEAGIILTQIADALHFLHTRGTIHRDIKPGNILLDVSNSAWLADFGLAKKLEEPTHLTAEGRLMGTPYYMAPELVKHPASTSSDIYALGVVVYEMLTGTRPFTGEHPVVVCWKQAYELPPLPSLLNSSIFPALEQVLLRALAKDPQARFSTAQELAETYSRALMLFEAGKATEMIALANAGNPQASGKPAQVREAAPQKRRQFRLRASAAAVALILLVLGIALGGLTNLRSASLLTSSAIHRPTITGHITGAAAGSERPSESSLLVAAPLAPGHHKHHHQKDQGDSSD